MMIEVSEQMKQNIVNDYTQNGLTFGEIANKLGMKREEVRTIVNREAHRLHKSLTRNKV